MVLIDDTKLSMIALTDFVTYINSNGTTNSTQGFDDKFFFQTRQTISKK